MLQDVTLFRRIAPITDPALLRRIRKVVERVEAAQNFQQIPNLKRLEATGKYYRTRLGDYRIGCVFERANTRRKEAGRFQPARSALRELDPQADLLVNCNRP